MEQNDVVFVLQKVNTLTIKCFFQIKIMMKFMTLTFILYLIYIFFIYILLLYHIFYRTLLPSTTPTCSANTSIINKYFPMLIFNMAAQTSSTRFTDEYELKEELGK